MALISGSNILPVRVSLMNGKKKWVKVEVVWRRTGLLVVVFALGLDLLYSHCTVHM